MADLQSRVQQSLSDQYTIERELGGGGMSKVFVANEHRLGRKVVIKVMSPELAAALSAPRFEREIRVAASLQQANIVPVLAAGDAEGLPYYTMPYVDGESLRARLARGPLVIGEVVSILRDVARALDYAHAHGVVHRDIKPDNVLLSGHTAVVTDFGIAKAIAAASEGPAGATLTQLGTAVGTPAYMAPEQAAGDPGTDHRADIYAFGCLAYELLTGQPPFPGLPPHKLLVAHMSEKASPVSQLRLDCPPALAALVDSCLEKDPTSRPAIAAELIQRLDAVSSPSAPHATMPAILLGGRPMLVRALVVYAVAFVGVGILARAAIIALGLPDWVFPGALVLMALGLPVVLFTAYTQYVAHRAAAATPTFTPGGTPSMVAAKGAMATLALRASPHVSWKRTTRGGILAAAAFVLSVAGYMSLRALGIGPAGSLLASGKLSNRDRVVVAAFEAPASDSALGHIISEAVRTDLAQSTAVRIVPVSVVSTTLEQMQRTQTTSLDLATAREVAQRAGAKAVIAGSIAQAGSGYIVSVRLVAAETGDVLAAFRESANDPNDLIPCVDRLTKSLRGKIGESLSAVRATPSLDQVTTASLDALRSYMAGLHAADNENDYVAAIEYYRDAIRRDTTFAMAYVQLSYALSSIPGAARQVESRAAMTNAYRLRDRLPEIERYNVEGAYYLDVVNDRAKALPALRRALQLDSTNVDASNTLGGVLAVVRQFEEADEVFRLADRFEPGTRVILGNIAAVNIYMGRGAVVDSMLDVMKQYNLPNLDVIQFNEQWRRRNYLEAESVAQRMTTSSSAQEAIAGNTLLASLTSARGRFRESERYAARSREEGERVFQDTMSPYEVAYRQAVVEGELRGNIARGTTVLDAARKQHPLGSTPVEFDGSPWLALGYARLGDAGKAREVLEQYESRLNDVDRRDQHVMLARVHGAIALAEGNADSAVVYFQRSDREADGLPTTDCSACVKFYLGMAFDRANQPDSAVKYLTSYIETFSWNQISIDRFYLAPALYRLGELHEGLGDVTSATEYYGRFVDLWNKADAELQPRVAEARRRIDRLNASSR